MSTLRAFVGITVGVPPHQKEQQEPDHTQDTYPERPLNRPAEPQRTADQHYPQAYNYCARNQCALFHIQDPPSLVRLSSHVEYSRIGENSRLRGK